MASTFAITGIGGVLRSPMSYVPPEPEIGHLHPLYDGNPSILGTFRINHPFPIIPGQLKYHIRVFGAINEITGCSGLF